MGFKEWKKKRKLRKLERADQYDLLEAKLKAELLKIDDVQSEDFRKVRQELKEINVIRAESRESKRRISKQDKGGIFIKLLSIIGAGAGIGSIILAERQGMVFTGEKRSVMDSISRALGNVFFKR